MATLSRRKALTAAAAIGGGVGLTGVALPAAASADEPSFARLELTLTSGTPRLTGDSRTLGSSYLVRADLLSGDEVAGEFFAQAVVANRRDLLVPGVRTLQTQTFVLDRGTLVGSGTLAHDGVGAFVVTGGTGDFHGATGSYTVAEADDGASSAYSFVLELRKAPIDGR